MHKRFRATGTVLTLAVTASLATAATAAAAAPSSDRMPSPTDRARAAGIDHQGGAYMGWSAKGHGGPRSTAPSYRTLDGGFVARSSSRTSGVQGIDVSSWQGNVDWKYWWNQGKRFAYVKATEGNYYTNEYFDQQYNGSRRVGMIRGAYHFANPSVSSGRGQATYFVNHGGDWRSGGKTLPGVLDIEYNPYGNTCYNKTKSQMVRWITRFVNRYKTLTGRDVVIYTNYDWWKRCTGNSTKFNRTNPLWVARYASSPGTLPGRWPYYTFWQYTANPIDKNKFNGSYYRLKVLARGY